MLEKLEYQMSQALLYASPTKIHDFGVVPADFLELASGMNNAVLKCYSTHFVSRTETNAIRILHWRYTYVYMW